MCGGRKIEAVEDLPLSAGRSYGMDHTAQRRLFLHQGTDPKRAKDVLRRQTFFGLRFVVGNGLAILTLDEMVSGQPDLEEKDEGLDPGRRFEK